MNTFSISALIIARNEQATVEKVIKESIRVLSKLTDKYEILINDDASSDKTTTILDLYAKKYSFIKIYHQKKPLGISGGTELLYSKAKYDLIFANAVDGQFTAYDLPRMVKKIYQGYDLVIGKRKKKIEYNIIRRIMTLCFAFIPKILFGKELYDPGSMKLYKREIIKNTKPLSKSVFSEAERIIRTYQLGYSIVSVPIRHFPRKTGRSSAIKLKLVVHSTFDMLKLFFFLNKDKL